MTMSPSMPTRAATATVVDRARLRRRTRRAPTIDANADRYRLHRARCVNRANRRRVASSETPIDADAADDAADDAQALKSAMRAATESESQGYSPGAGIGLSPDEQALAAYADMINTSPRAGALDDDDVEALASGGRMDARARRRTRGGFVDDVQELFKALFGGAHIVRSDD